MKGSTLTKFIVIVVLFASVLLSYVVLFSEIKRMNKERLTKQEMLNEKNNSVEMRLVEVQKLTSETRIVKIARDSLGMVRPTENLKIMTISKDRTNQIENMLNEKYD